MRVKKLINCQSYFPLIQGRFNIILLLFIILSFHSVLFGAEQIVTQNKGGVAIFYVPQKNYRMNYFSSEIEKYLKGVFNNLGRFKPVEKNQITWALSQISPEEKNFYNRAAELLRVDIYIIISSFHLGLYFYTELKVVSLNPEYKQMEKIITETSVIFMNVPLKAGREIAYLHELVPIKARIIKDYKNGMYLISAGQWNGLEKEEYFTITGNKIQVLQQGRYDSLIQMSGDQRAVDEIILIKHYCNVKKIVNEINNRLHQNTVNRYSLRGKYTEGVSPEKRLIEGICIINMGGNILLPVYGAFLSTHYLGFKNSSPDYNGIALATSSIFMQLFLTEFMTSFRINFFPWKRDKDKTKKMQNLQKYLWASIPITFSVAYMDQLAFQFLDKNVLPPFYLKKDASAVIFSAFIPGGGLFYKGHLTAGWCYYFSEMIMAGYGVYNLDSGNRGVYAYCALGVIKLIEMIHSFYARSSYMFYKREIDRGISRTSFSLGVNRLPTGESIYAFSAFYRY